MGVRSAETERQGVSGEGARLWDNSASGAALISLARLLGRRAAQSYSTQSLSKKKPARDQGA